mgnify:CR=1 FL=1
MDNNLRREIILDNYQDPMNRGLIDDDSYLKTNTNSESCIDNLDFMMKIEDGIVKDIRFDGEACAISTSASSIMIRSLIGKKKEEALEILDNYRKMINEEEYDSDVLGELNVYDEICNQCGGYIYDVEDVYQKLFQRIYNASTSLYYAVVFGSNKELGEIECIKRVLNKTNEILSELLFPQEIEDSIRNLLLENGLDAKELLIETPSLMSEDYKDLVKYEH